MKTFSKMLISHIEKKYKIEEFPFKSGDIINLLYQTKSHEKERPVSVDGIIIAIKNKETNKSFTIRQAIKGYFIDQKFFAHSPKIVKITRKNALSKKKSKLYYINSF